MCRNQACENWQLFCDPIRVSCIISSQTTVSLKKNIGILLIQSNDCFKLTSLVSYLCVYRNHISCWGFTRYLKESMGKVSRTLRFFESPIIYDDFFLYLFYIHILNFGIEKLLMSSNNKKKSYYNYGCTLVLV